MEGGHYQDYPPVCLFSRPQPVPWGRVPGQHRTAKGPCSPASMNFWTTRGNKPGPKSKVVPGPTCIRSCYHSGLMVMEPSLALLETPNWGHCVCACVMPPGPWRLRHGEEAMGF